MKKLVEFIKQHKTLSIGIGVALIVIILVIGSSSSGSSADSLFQTEALQRGNLTATAGATGSVRARQSAILPWRISGIVQDVNVIVGDRVKRGEELARLNKTSLPQNVIAAEADIVSAQRALEDLLNSDTAQAQALINLEKAKDTYERAYEYRESLNNKIDIQRIKYKTVGGKLIPEIVYSKGYADEETIADADNKLALTRGQLEDAQRIFDRVKDGPNPEDVAAAEARVAAAQATLDMAYIMAPFDGVITQADSNPGDLINAGNAAFRVDDLSHLQVDVSVSEVDINNIAVNQTATLLFDAVFNKEYHGKVIEVGQAGTVSSGVVNFTVTVEITDPDEQVKPGMTAAVNIIINEVKDVLLIPNRAVRLINGDRVVYVMKDGQPTRVKIQIGASSDIYSVLLDGDLQEDDLVVLNPPSGGGFGE